MRPQDLIAAFGTLAESPNGVTRLRELVLQLAVRGRLVSQDSNEEPASTLLDRIAKEKAQLVKEGKIRKPKPLPSVSTDKVPFEAPVGWVWCRLGAISYQIHYGYTASADYDQTGCRLLRITDIQDNRVDWATVPGCDITPEGVAKYALADCDIVVARTGGTVGKTYRVVGLGDLDAVFASYLIRVAPPMDTDSRYLKRAMETPLYWQQLLDKTMGTGQPNVNASSLSTLILPIPPLAEQHRIVARVDELMDLLDRLEAARNAREDTRAALRDAALAALQDAGTTEEVEVAWNRVAERMGDLFTDPTDVDPLRQTILQLAVRGRLVPQDPDDEPASRLLNGQTLTKKASMPKLPDGWSWTTMSKLGEVRGGGTPSKRNSKFWGGSVPWVSPKDMKRDLIGESQDYITEAAVKGSSVKRIPVGSLLMVVRGMILAHSFPVALTITEVTINQDMKALLPFDRRIASYLLLMMKGLRPEVLQLVKRSTHGTCKLVTDELFTIPLPVPPLAEQNRIVAKVDELMNTLDRLEERLVSMTAAHNAFAAAAVHHLDA